MSTKALDRLVNEALEQGGSLPMEGLYPFLSQMTLEKIAEKKMKEGGLRALASLAPFL